MTTDRATLLATINNSPLILSLLYDLNLLPEQVEAETADDSRMIKIVVILDHFEKIMSADSAEIATLRAQVAAGDALHVIAGEYYQFSSSQDEDEYVDSRMSQELVAYDAAKGVKP